MVRRLTSVLLLAVTAAAAPAPLAAQTRDRPQEPPAATSSGDVKSRKNFLLPIAEIVAMDAGINLAARHTSDGRFYEVTGASIRHNLRAKWVVDDDPFQVNQFLHPYQGAMYHGIARSAGLDYWQSMIYAFAGSALWEVAGEITPPSKNDQIASGIGGPFFGEPLFRMADAILHGVHGTRASPGPWRVIAATVVSPPTGINHMMFGDRYHPAASANIGVTDLRLQLGVTGLVSSTARADSPLLLNRGLARVSIDYGLPGQATYAHKRPFDYFSTEASVSAAHGVESVSTRGLLVGNDFNTSSTAGVFGLYGHYDYLSSEAFRFSTTALSLGSSAQLSLSKDAVVQATALAGVGYSAAQTVRGSEEQDYHYGLAPQGLLAAKLILGRRFSLDGTVRDYYVTDVGSFVKNEHDRILRADGSVSMRLVQRHAIAITYSLARRRAFVAGQPDVTQSSKTLGVFYTFLSSGGFGAIR
jgi:hypothetical protein